MVRIVWGCFLIFAGFCTLGYALTITGTAAALDVLSSSMGMPRQLVAMSRQGELFYYFLTALLFVIGSGLVYWGDKERSEDLIHKIRLMSIDR